MVNRMWQLNQETQTKKEDLKRRSGSKVGYHDLVPIINQKISIITKRVIKTTFYRNISSVPTNVYIIINSRVWTIYKRLNLITKTTWSHDGSNFYAIFWMSCTDSDHEGCKDKESQLWKTAVFRQIAFSTREL